MLQVSDSQQATVIGGSYFIYSGLQRAIRKNVKMGKMMLQDLGAPEDSIQCSSISTISKDTFQLALKSLDSRSLAIKFWRSLKSTCQKSCSEEYPCNSAIYRSLCLQPTLLRSSSSCIWCAEADSKL